MALSFRTVVRLFAEGRKNRTSRRMARTSFRPVLEGLEERAVPSVTPLHVTPAVAVHHDSQDKQPEMKIEFQQEKSGDLAPKGDDKAESKAERQIEKTDSSRDKSLDDRGTQQSNDSSSNDPSSTSVTDQVFSSADSQDLKDC